MFRRLRPNAAWLALVAWGLAGSACRSKKASGPAPSARASAAPPSSAAPATSNRCRRVARGGLVIGAASAPVGASDEDERPELPFATALGSAATLPNGFAVSGINAEDAGTAAFVAFIPLGGEAGRSVSLGAVHGDPDPPVVAASGDAAIVAVETSDASGRVVELHRVAPNAEKPERGSEIVDVGESGMALAFGEKAGVIVWSAGKGSKATLRSAAVSNGAPRLTGTPVDVPGTNDAESPLLRARPGGFWLAWISERLAPDAGAREADGSAEETRPLEAASRVLMVAPLGANGAPDGAARAVSGDASHVIAFDAATLADGALGLAWREDDAAPGGETGASELARVGPDGAIRRGRSPEEALSAGAPVLLREGAAPHRVWLFVPGEDDRMRMALLAPDAASTSPFVGDDALRGADVLAAQSGKPCGKEKCVSLLLARTRDRAVELGLAECRP